MTMMLMKMLSEATPSQLEEFASLLKSEISQGSINKLCEGLYRLIYGSHFNEWSLKEALSSMKNEDGSEGGHWSVEQTMSMAEERGVPLDGSFNEYDWCYAMNMVRSDYYGSVPDETSSYVALARRFLEDRDAPPGKAFRYYMCMR